MKCHPCALFLFMLLSLPGFCRAVTIRRLIVPRWVRNGTDTPAVLDCEYVYNENDLKLVVKWFFNDGPEPVYQWIPEMRVREAFGVLQGRLDDTFSVSSRDVYSQYRAIRILRPTWELSGKYTCVVTSLAGQDARHQDMTVFVPAKSFTFNYSSSTAALEEQYRSRSAESAVRLLCMARGTYPRPELKLFLIKGGARRAAGDAGLRTYATATIEDGLFNVALHADMNEGQLSTLADLFECVLEIPYSSYVTTRRMSLAHELTWGAYGSSAASSVPILSFYSIALSLSIYIVTTLQSNGGYDGRRHIFKSFPKKQEDT
ncbi:uncharacterized protein [Dermacentor albipictus]|uniref:uncharacterized protein n=1 Tax=Dermacentor albipictus TaxID=60249 RepID=UPI0031FC2970